MVWFGLVFLLPGTANRKQVESNDMLTCKDFQKLMNGMAVKTDTWVSPRELLIP